MILSPGKLARMIPMLALVIAGQCNRLWADQKPRTIACVAFAPDGSLATGTIRDGELETRLAQPKLPITRVQTFVGNARDCELAFSPDGKWLAAVIQNDKLTVLIFDRNTGTTYRNFSSEWHTLESHADTVPHIDSESKYWLPHLGGFLQEGSLVLWQISPPAGRLSFTIASGTALHLERWSIQGTRLSDQYLASWSEDIAVKPPVTANHLHRLLVRRGTNASGGQLSSDDLTKMEDEGLYRICPEIFHALADITKAATIAMRCRQSDKSESSSNGLLGPLRLKDSVAVHPESLVSFRSVIGSMSSS